MFQYHLRVRQQSNCSHVAGQGMTEYIIIVALIAVAAIGVYSLLGKTVRGQVAGIASEVTGQTSADQLTNARAAARRAQTLGRQDINLGNYDEVTESDN